MQDIDTGIALLPVGGTYTMNPDEAALACKAIGPKLAIPMHYGSIVGTKDDAQTFTELAECDTMILTQGETKTL